MSTPNPNPSPSISVSVSHPINVTASETPVTKPNTVKQPQSPAPSHRALAPVHLHPHQNPYTHPVPMRQSNSAANSHHPDPSSLINPFGYSGQGFQTRPGRHQHHSNPVADTGGYPNRPVYAYQNGQFGSNLDPMVQFMRAHHPQNQQSPQFGSGPVKGVPHFLQPRVTPSPTSILDNSGHKKSRSRDDALTLVRKRKVRITEGASLYSLCRSWLRNGVHEGIQPQRSDTMTCLPKPLPAYITETSLPKESVEEPNISETSLPKESVEEANSEEDKEHEEAVKQLSESDLLKKHVDRAKNVRARLKEERLKKIARYKARLALLLPPYGEQCRDD